MFCLNANFKPSLCYSHNAFSKLNICCIVHRKSFKRSLNQNLVLKENTIFDNSTIYSLRLFCTTGRCECLLGARGEKCDHCADDLVMTPSGCLKREEFHAPRSCSLLKCHHGAKCVESQAGLPNCECPEQCIVDHLGIVANMSVCGSDGTTYEDMCQLTQFACKHQLDVVAVSLGICPQVANMSVCGSDGTTYEDMCQLTQFACKHQLDVVAVSLGICPQGKPEHLTSLNVPMLRVFLFADSTGPRERNNRQKILKQVRNIDTKVLYNYTGELAYVNHIG
ncbi:unnamed protein product [Strongylus vulgaris]|uniref:Kazal-like domain-containing protein n=1 Tax=Strongylus vulgaris TaxID=40348 RepID=A0A3P7JLE6_STRVU|nr:unnamed protein product [Strongylus vulgaris]